MTTRIAILLASSLLAGCATHSPYSLEWQDQSADLYVIRPNGEPATFGAGGGVMLPGYLIAGEMIRMHPGSHTVGVAACPRPDGLEITDSRQFVTFRFEAGRSYELRCKDGAPVVTDRR
jgi:hypothetical protein